MKRGQQSGADTVCPTSVLAVRQAEGTAPIGGAGEPWNPPGPPEPDSVTTRIRRILASPEAAKRRVDGPWVHVLEFHQFLTIG
jgi:hypothetical protein